MSDRTPASGGLLLVTVDWLPAWILPPYGCTWVAMPALSGLAARGIVCDRLLAVSDDPHATSASLAGRTGTAAAWPLLTAAAAAGWQPTVVTDDAAFAEALAAAATVRQVLPAAAEEIAADEGATNLGRLFAVATDLASDRDRRFLWCHAASLGMAWDAPAEFRDAYLDPEDPPPPPGAIPPDVAVDNRTDPDLVVGLRHVFAGQLTLLDACLGRLVDAVTDRSAAEPWTLLVAGSRGMPLGLHGRVGPAAIPPFSELVHLPAILVDHRGRMAAQRYGGLLAPADLAATLLAVVGGDPTAGADPGADPRAGRSLGSLLETWTHRERDRVICRAAHGTAVATPAWHCLVPRADDGVEPAPRLYAKPDDFFEVCDVADRCPEVAAELAAIVATEPGEAWNRPLSAAAVGGV